MQSSFQLGKYIVLYGAGGSAPCSAYMQITEEIIVDQTLYWTIVDSENEAIYLSAMLNCPKLNEIISTFQPQGLFGKRHIHTLPLDYIPIYQEDDDNMNLLVKYSKKLIEELNASISGELLNPNTGTLSNRRKKINDLLTKQNSYEQYLSICEKILISSHKETNA